MKPEPKTYIAQKAFKFGGVWFHQGSEVVYDGAHMTIDGVLYPPTAHIRGAIKVGWLVEKCTPKE